MIISHDLPVPSPTGLLASHERQDLNSPQLSVPSTPADYTEFSGYLPNIHLCSNNNLFSPLPVNMTDGQGDETLDLSRYLAGELYS